MRALSPVLALSLMLGGCVLPGTQTSKAIDVAQRESVIGSGNLGGRVVTGGNVIAAGGGNVIAAGGGNVIAAGGGNVISTGGGAMGAPGAAENAAATPILSGLTAASSAGVVAAGGMDLAPKPSMDTDSPNAPITLPPETAPAPLTGHVYAPGAIAGQPGVLLPLGKAKVGVYTTEGNPVGEPVETNAQGAFTLPAVPTHQIYSLRTEFEIGDNTYYLGSVFRLEGGDGVVDLTPFTTVAEARFYTRCAARVPVSNFIGEPYLDAFWAATQGLNGEVNGSAVQASASLATRTAAYDALKLAHPAAFQQDIDAVFDKTATNAEGASPPGEAPGEM